MRYWNGHCYVEADVTMSDMPLDAPAQEAARARATPINYEDPEVQRLLAEARAAVIARDAAPAAVVPGRRDATDASHLEDETENG